MTLRYRKHTRLPGHSYLQGPYFVTMCTYWRIQVSAVSFCQAPMPEWN